VVVRCSQGVTVVVPAEDLKGHYHRKC
jgi:hypothetical protein